MRSEAHRNRAPLNTGGWRFESSLAHIMGKDKIIHFIVCFVLAALTALITSNIIIGWLSAVVVGLAKELYDRYSYGVFDIYDLIADVLGATCSILIIVIL